MRIATLALLALVVAAGCGGSDDQTATPPPASTVTTETTPATSAREAAPAVTGTTVEGDAIALDDFRGRPVLVNVWSSW